MPELVEAELPARRTWHHLEELAQTPYQHPMRLEHQCPVSSNQVGAPLEPLPAEQQIEERHSMNPHCSLSLQVEETQQLFELPWHVVEQAVMGTSWER